MPSDADGLFQDIDQHSLDTEWTAHCRYVAKYTRLLADAKDEYTQAKSRQEFVQAELSEDVRNHPERFHVEGKLTEGRVEAIVLVQPAYQQTVLEVNAAKRNLDVLQASVSTLDHRRRALEDYVTLWSQAYFDRPRVPESARLSGVAGREFDAARDKAVMGEGIDKPKKKVLKRG